MVGCHLHGTASSVACELSSQLALQLLSNPPVIIYSLMMHSLKILPQIQEPVGFESYLGSAVVKSPGAALPLNMGLAYV